MSGYNNLSFDIQNIPFSNNISNLTIYDLLNANPNCLHVLIMAYNSNNDMYQQRIIPATEEEQNLYNIQITEDAELVLVEIDFDSTWFDMNNINSWYATYSIVYENESILSPELNLKYSYEKGTYQSLEEDMTEADNKANAILNKWLYQDLLKVKNNLNDTHKHFIVNEHREIKLEESNDKVQNILLTKDNDSEEITFRIPRYYDGIDLTTKNISIYYIRPENDYDKDVPQNIIEDLLIEDYNENYITATWVVTNQATSTEGKLIYAIIAEGDGLEDEYFWQTKPSYFQVDKGIYGNVSSKDSDFSFIDKSSFRTNVYETIKKIESTYDAGEIKWQSLADLVK